MLYFKNFMRLSQQLTKDLLHRLGIAPKESCRI